MIRVIPYFVNDLPADVVTSRLFFPGVLGVLARAYKCVSEKYQGIRCCHCQLSMNIKYLSIERMGLRVRNYVLFFSRIGFRHTVVQ